MRPIDANALIRKIHDEVGVPQNSFDTVRDCIKVVEMIQEMQTLEPEELRQRAMWQEVILPDGSVAYRCTNCETTWDDKTKACPNCGAKM